MGLMDFKARMYDPYLNRWTQPDTIVADALNPQTLDRFAYVLNNPLRYSDPTGHRIEEGCRDNGRCDLPAPGIDWDRHERLLDLRDKAEHLSQLMHAGKLTDVDALSQLFSSATHTYGTDKYGLLSDLGIVVGGLDTRGALPQLIPDSRPGDAMGQYYVGYGAFEPQDGTQSGFRTDLNPRQDNQVRHFLAGAAGRNLSGFHAMSMLAQETAAEDRALYRQAFAFVDWLFGSPAAPGSGHNVAEAPGWLADNLGR
jgi:hypothetical protein